MSKPVLLLVLAASVLNLYLISQIPSQPVITGTVTTVNTDAFDPAYWTGMMANIATSLGALKLLVTKK